MEAILPMNGFMELTEEDLMMIDGGAWSWKEFGRTTLAGAVGGGITGAFGGSMTLPVIGTVSGAVGGAIVGGLGGAAVYITTGWW
ncbi:lactobin A/cerein 7B family class IIb bacteriocin [Thermohydrogenium kirishiense]|nr:lactobin A/cerein 7B family class IIb bacteriocin [Thermohydrogenium kirishiense]